MTVWKLRVDSLEVESYIELLAPAKNKEIGIAAIDCGADALYIAGPEFGARESASNSFEDIAEVVNYAHKFAAKVYLTLNTILYEDELERARKMIIEAYNIGCDAIIVQDLGILKMDDLPPITLHASTQTAARTVEQVQFLESLGFSRVVLARELSIDQISEIRENTTCELESFIHGSLCVSYSGNCYLSQKLSGRGANRGSCIQACRSLYDLQDSKGKILIKNAPLLSLKDLALPNHIPQMIEAGVMSFKIEGRLKGADYVKNVTRYYRGVIDDFIAQNHNYSKSSFGSIYKGFTPDLYKSFNRGYTNLFIEGKRGKWRSSESTTSIGEYIGVIKKIINTERYNTTFSIDSDKQILNGDGLLFVLDNMNVGMRADVVKNSQITVKNSPIIKVGTKVYRNYDSAFEKTINSSPCERLIDIELIITSSTEGSLTITATPAERSIQAVELNVAVPEIPAENQEAAKRNLFNQLEKRSGVYRFRVKSVDLKHIPFFPLSTLNGFRRKLARILDEAPKYSPETEGKIRSRLDKSPEFKGRDLTYLYNSSNPLSRSLYEDYGAKKIDPAYELKPVANAELMRCKYCIRYEFGMCPGRDAEPLYLINGANKFTLLFDCERCEMVVVG